MDIKHIQYLVEIERVHSISQAAENLYLGQPNLSRILRDVEESVGFPIFERTSKGVHPTPRGAIFLQHAHNILREMDAVTMLGPHNSVGDLLRVCIPHSEAAFRVVADYIRSLAPDTTFDSVVRECHVKRALDYLSEGQAEIAIVRFRGSMRTISGKKPRLWDFPCRSWSTIRTPWWSMKVIPWRTGRTSPSRRPKAMYRLSIQTGISCPISRTGAGAFTPWTGRPSWNF